MVNIAKFIRSDSLSKMAKQGLAPFSDTVPAKKRWRDMKHSASDYSQEMSKNIDNYVVQHPYAVAGIALAMGVLVGGALARRF